MDKLKVPQASVVVPTYGHPDLVLATLESVFAQEGFHDYEVLVVNDGSPDDTAERLRPLAEAGRIRYVEQPVNAGVAAARNRGLAEARGEFIAFLDDDDLWPADKLAWQVEFLRTHREVGLVGGLVEMMDERGEPGKTDDDGKDVFGSEQFNLESLFGGNPFHSPGQWLARTDVIRQLGGFDPRFWATDDYDLLLRAARMSRIVRVKRPALRYRLHAGNASRDLAKMLVNMDAVVQSNLPYVSANRRTAAARVAHHLLYPYLGKPLLRGAWRDLKAGRWTYGWETLRMVAGVFWRFARRDLRGFFQMLVPAVRRRFTGV